MAHDIREICVDPEPPSAHYWLQDTIGEGSFGKVVLAEHLLTKTKVAVKILKERVSDSRHRSLLNEVYCMAALNHPNIVRLFHVVSSEDSLFLVMELVLGGDLRRYLGAHGRMSEDVARGVFRQLVSAVQYCHTKGIAHRDLKPHNVLLDVRMTAKLADFGLAKSSNIHQLNTFCGSPLYAAPELFQSPTFSGRAADNWSLGVLLYEMLTNTVPFRANTWAGVKRKVVRGRYVIPPFLSTEVERFLEKLLTLVPEQRENLETLMPHPWLNRDQDQELQPYVEPTADAMDPGVMEQMVTMGIRWEDMKETLSPGVYDNNIMATYRILQTEKAKPCHRIIKVKPYRPPDFQSRSPSPVREVQREGSGFQKAEQQQTVHEVGQMAQGSAGPKAIVEDKTTVAETKATTSPSGTESTNSTCEATWGSSNAASDPSTIEHSWGSGPPTPKQCWGSGPPTSKQCRGSGPTTPEPTTPKHILSSITSTAKHSRGSRSATSEDSRGSRTSAPERRWSSRTTTAEPSTTEHRPGSMNTTAEHAPGSMNTTAEHAPGSMNTTPEHRPGSRNIIAEPSALKPSWGSQNAAPAVSRGSRTDIAEQRPASRTATPQLGPGSSTTTISQASQCHPGDSLSSHFTSSSGMSQAIKQGRWRVARRFWHFFRKLCCLPPKKGHCQHRQVKPL